MSRKAGPRKTTDLKPATEKPKRPANAPEPAKPVSAPTTSPSPDRAQARLALLRTSNSGSDASPRLFPSDHVKLLLELLRPCGVELARRWVAALMLVPVDEREAVVSAIEARLAREYAGASYAGEGRLTSVVHPPVQREGYVEQVFTSYSVAEDARRTGPGEAKGKPGRNAG